MQERKYTLKFDMRNNKYLIVNPIIEKAAIVDKECISLLGSISSMKKIDEDKKEILSLLLKEGFLRKDGDATSWDLLEKKYKKYIISLPEKHKNNLIEKFFTFDIVMNYECNMNCVYCFQKRIKNSKLMKQKINVDVAIEYIKKHFYSENDIVWSKFPLSERKRVIALTGGEPLLMSNRDKINKILDFSLENEIEVRITTNGLNLNGYIPLLENYSSILSLRITIDGPKEIHDKRRPQLNGEGSFDEIVKGIDKAYREGIGIIIISKFDWNNIEYLDKFAEFLSQKDWGKNISLDYVDNGTNPYYNGDYEENVEGLIRKVIDMISEKPYLLDYFDIGFGQFDMLWNLYANGKIPKIKFLNCGAYTCNGAILAPNGKIYSCEFFAMYDLYPIGEYYPKEEIYYDNIHELRKRSIHYIKKIKKCHDCNLLPICGGGCLFKALKNTKIDIWKQTTCMPRNIFEEEMSKFVATNIKIRKEKEVK